MRFTCSGVKNDTLFSNMSASVGSAEVLLIIVLSNSVRAEMLRVSIVIPVRSSHGDGSVFRNDSRERCDASTSRFLFANFSRHVVATSHIPCSARLLCDDGLELQRRALTWKSEHAGLKLHGNRSQSALTVLSRATSSMAMASRLRC